MKTSPDYSLRVLVVHGQPKLAEFLSVSLGYEGYQVLTVADGREGLVCAREGSFDLVILSTQLPGLDGFQFCQRLRTASDVPVLMLAAQDVVADHVKGLDLGADDYVIEPFNFIELLARIRAILRRRGGVQMRTAVPAPRLDLDREARSAEWDGRRISLTVKEFDLLELLSSHPRQVLPRQVILDHVWNRNFDGDTNLLEVYICRLRSKLDDRPPHLIKTIWGVGYMWLVER